MQMKTIVFAATIVVMLASCGKAVENVKNRLGSNTPASQFVEHLIVKGSHSSNKNSYRPVNTTEMKFTVKFDNSAVYATIIPSNQGDINKLYGFSDNNQEHHLNSARIGWRWFENQLQLFAYVYNNSVQSEKLITSVQLNQDITCSIRAEGNNYTFNVNGVSVSMPRTSTTAGAVGYQLYPYFGGDEVAPQDIRILVKDL